ncbi:hypothetical protein FHT86_002400 [Rhizobium sp. BK313]|jgi:hypothetical protein|nr:hypothetical protein [Rhizobium sp. BK313]
MVRRKKTDMIEQKLFGNLTWLAASHLSTHYVPSKLPAGMGG